MTPAIDQSRIEDQGALLQIFPVPLVTPAQDLHAWAKGFLDREKEKLSVDRFASSGMPERFQQTWKPPSESFELQGVGLLVIDNQSLGGALMEEYREAKYACWNARDEFMKAFPKDGLLILRRYFQPVRNGDAVGALMIRSPVSEGADIALSIIDGEALSRAGRNRGLEADGLGEVLEHALALEACRPSWGALASRLCAQGLTEAWVHQEEPGCRSQRPRF